MQRGYVGIDLAIAKGKRLPVVVCTVEGGILTPQPLRRLRVKPPRGMGNVSVLDGQRVRAFVRDAAHYIADACDALGLAPARIGIDAPRCVRSPDAVRRASERALDLQGISCFTTPSEEEFENIRAKVADHLRVGGAESELPHANQLWMLAGFDLFSELARIAPCLEVYPQATVHVLDCAQIHKSKPGGVEAQMVAAAAYTGWPVADSSLRALDEIAWGPRHDRLDAYLAAWVASLEEHERIACGVPPDDVIWVPRIEGMRSPVKAVVLDEAAAVSRPEQGRHVENLSCPACGHKQFKRWPLGWDGHAAHACRGLVGADPTARKLEFRQRFGQYFKH